MNLEGEGVYDPSPSVANGASTPNPHQALKCFPSGQIINGVRSDGALVLAGIAQQGSYTSIPSTSSTEPIVETLNTEAECRTPFHSPVPIESIDEGKEREVEELVPIAKSTGTGLEERDAAQSASALVGGDELVEAMEPQDVCESPVHAITGEEQPAIIDRSFNDASEAHISTEGIGDAIDPTQTALTERCNNSAAPNDMIPVADDEDEDAETQKEYDETSKGVIEVPYRELRESAVGEESLELIDTGDLVAANEDEQGLAEEAGSTTVLGDGNELPESEEKKEEANDKGEPEATYIDTPQVSPIMSSSQEAAGADREVFESVQEEIAEQKPATTPISEKVSASKGDEELKAMTSTVSEQRTTEPEHPEDANKNGGEMAEEDLNRALKFLIPADSPTPAERGEPERLIIEGGNEFVKSIPTTETKTTVTTTTTTREIKIHHLQQEAEDATSTPLGTVKSTDGTDSPLQRSKRKQHSFPAPDDDFNSAAPAILTTTNHISHNGIQPESQKKETIHVVHATGTPYHGANSGITTMTNGADYTTTCGSETSISPRTLSRISRLNVVMQRGKDGAEVIHHHPIFMKDTSKYWYKPSISREEAISILKNKPAGTFVVRDSNSFPGAFGLALKVAQPPAGVPVGDGTELVRHFLIEPSPKGVKLKGCNNEPVFGTLAALVYQHSVTPLALPCKLILPDYDPASTPEHLNSSQALLERGAACNVTYLCSIDTESLTGPEALRRAVSHNFDLFDRSELRAVPVHFKVSSQGITLTDNTRSLFFRRHYPVHSVTYAGIDPESRLFDNNHVAQLPPTYVRKAPIFGFVARQGNNGGGLNSNGAENGCHVFAELDPDQPASAVVRFITNVMMPQAAKNYKKSNLLD